MMVAGGAVQALWVPRGLAIKYADTVGGYAPALIAALRRYWGDRLRLSRRASLFRSHLVSDLSRARKEPLSALDGAGELRASVAIGPAGRADFCSSRCHIGRGFYESFDSHFFSGIGRLYLEPAARLTR